jgi:hypothetical protein
MADTNHPHATRATTEGDGVSYRGIAWFVAILAVTTITCQVLMWALFRHFESREAAESVQRAPMALPAETPHIDERTGQLVPATPTPPPALLVTEPLGLQEFRQQEDQILTTYGWVDQNAGTVRIPIERAKALLLERGIPGGVPMPGAAKPPAGGGGR